MIRERVKSYEKYKKCNLLETLLQLEPIHVSLLLNISTHSRTVLVWFTQQAVAVDNFLTLTAVQVQSKSRWGILHTGGIHAFTPVCRVPLDTIQNRFRRLIGSHTVYWIPYIDRHSWNAYLIAHTYRRNTLQITHNTNAWLPFGIPQTAGVHAF